MAQRVAAIFGSREAARRAAEALSNLGADREQISLLARGDEGGVTTTTAAEHHESEEMIAPAREVGDSGAALTTTDAEDAAAGAVAGGVYGGLRDLGIEEQYARGYEERIRSGDVLLTAMIPATAEDDVLDVLAEHGAEDVSFAEEFSTAGMGAGAALSDTMITEPAERSMTAPMTIGSVDTPAMTAPPAVDRMDVPATSVPATAGTLDTEPTTPVTADVLDQRTRVTSPPDVDLTEPRPTTTSPPATDVEEQRSETEEVVRERRA